MRPFQRLAIARIAIVAAGGLMLSATASAVPLARGRQFPELKLKNGTVLHDVTIVAVGTNSIVARWDGGQGSILVRQLPAEVQAEMPAPVVVKAPAAAASLAALPDPKLATAELPTEIKLTNGFVMHKSKVTRWDKNSVLVSYLGGIVSVRFANITPDQRAIFEARKDEALALQAKDDSNNTAGQATASREEQDRQAAEAHNQEEAEKLADEIKNGLAFHYLVKGMTKAQVIQAFGRPPDDTGDTFLYILRGHDKYGNAADRTLTFREGVLFSWRDARDGEPAGAVDH